MTCCENSCLKWFGPSPNNKHRPQPPPFPPRCFVPPNTNPPDSKCIPECQKRKAEECESKYKDLINYTNDNPNNNDPMEILNDSMEIEAYNKTYNFNRNATTITVSTQPNPQIELEEEDLSNAMTPSLQDLKNETEYEIESENMPPKQVTPQPILGCMIPRADNYNENATQDDPSNPCIIGGCTDINATNFDPEATYNNNTCEYEQPTQYTPQFSITGLSQENIINDMSNLFMSDSRNTGHHPEGIWWIPEWKWNQAIWDGQPIDPETLIDRSGAFPDYSALCAWIRPIPGDRFIVRGIREKFNQVKPFKDNANPTIPEIEAWHLEVIRHFREMFGRTTPVKYNARLMLETQWATERKETTAWDSTHPTDPPFFQGTFHTYPALGGTMGPCFQIDGTTRIDITGANGIDNPNARRWGHGGDSFTPHSPDFSPNNPDIQQALSSPPYLNNFTKYPELQNYNPNTMPADPTKAWTPNTYSEAVGIKEEKKDTPWSIKFANVIAGWICGEGTSGHAGPYVGGPNPPDRIRSEVGIAWWPSSFDSSLIISRVKWAS